MCWRLKWTNKTTTDKVWLDLKNTVSTTRDHRKWESHQTSERQQPWATSTQLHLLEKLFKYKTLLIVLFGLCTFSTPFWRATPRLWASIKRCMVTVLERLCFLYLIEGMQMMSPHGKIMARYSWSMLLNSFRLWAISKASKCSTSSVNRTNQHRATAVQWRSANKTLWYSLHFILHFNLH